MKPGPWLLPVLAALAAGGWIFSRKTTASAQEREILVVNERIQQAREAESAENPRAAAVTVLTLEPGLERDTAIEGVAIGWMESGASPSQIAAWAEELPAESAVERVRAVVAAEAAYDNPVLAWKQVEQIRNPMKRSELFQEVFPNLVEENPKLARRALATIQLSPVEIEYFQAMLAP